MGSGVWGLRVEGLGLRVQIQRHQDPKSRTLLLNLGLERAARAPPLPRGGTQEGSAGGGGRGGGKEERKKVRRRTVREEEGKGGGR